MPSEIRPQPNGLIEYALPVPAETRTHMTAAGSPLAEFAALDPARCRALLRERWSGLTFPPTRQLAENFLSQPGLFVSATSQPNSAGDQYWLTAQALPVYPEEDPDYRKVLSIPSIGPVPLPALEFSFDAIPGLREFLTHFGGLTNYSPPGAHFANPAELQVMTFTGEHTGWGAIEPWHGSLVLFHDRQQNALVVHPSGKTGKWFRSDAFPATEEELESLEAESRLLALEFSLKVPEEERAAYMENEAKYYRREIERERRRKAIVDLEKDFGGLLETYLEVCQEVPEDALDNTFYK